MFKFLQSTGAIPVASEAIGRMRFLVCLSQPNGHPLTVVLQTTSTRKKLALLFAEIARLSQEQLSDALPPQSHSTFSVLDKKPLPTEIGRFPGEAADGPVDEWLMNAVIPPPTTGPISVCLIVLWAGSLPGYVDFFARSISFSAKHGLNYVRVSHFHE
jgi:hypothetical protein